MSPVQAGWTPPEKSCPQCTKTHRGRYKACDPCRRRLVSEDPSDRVCGKCGIRRPVASFSRSSNPNVWCRACCRENAAAWRAANLDKARATDRARGGRQKTREGRRWHFDYRILTKYGLSRAAYDALVLAHEGRCALCEKATLGLVVDHCHQTGVVRGLLCNPCNQALGFLGDTLVHALRVADYLRRTAPTTGGVLTDHIG